MKLIGVIMSKVFIAFIKLYKGAISPYLMPSCRYTPTCSQYGIEAIQKYGANKGGYLTLKRFLSCGPWGKHGHNPVP